jgi:hypothetical protein
MTESSPTPPHSVHRSIAGSTTITADVPIPKIESNPNPSTTDSTIISAMDPASA